MSAALSNPAGLGASIAQLPRPIGDTAAALEFLKMLRPNGTVALTAIEPDGPTETDTFKTNDDAALADWIERRQGRKNLYFTVNPTRSTITSKAKAADIAEGVAVWADLDPEKSVEALPGGLERERERIRNVLAKLRSDGLQPSFVIDSGSGYQAFWRLDAASADTGAIEAINAALARRLGGDPAVRDIARIMRLPGTINVPTKSKIARGRKATLARLVPALGSCARYSLPTLAAFADPSASASAKVRRGRLPLGSAELLAPGFDDMPDFDAEAPRVAWPKEFRAVADALEAIDNRHLTDRNLWVGISAAAKFATNGNDTFYERIYLPWCLTYEDAQRNADLAAGARKLWYDDLEEGSGGWDALVVYAEQHSKGQWRNPYNSAEALFEGLPPEDPTDAAKTSAAQPHGYHAPPMHTIGRDIDLSHIPPRVWTLGTRFSPGVVTLGIAEPATGKTTIAMLSAVAIATGKALTEEKVYLSGPVWYIGNEEPIDELRRKLAAIKLAHRLSDDELAGRVHLSTFEELKLTVASKDGEGRVRITAAVEEMVECIKAHGIVHVVIDPLVSVHEGVEENDNASLEKVMTALRQIAVRAECSIDLLHHSNKAGANQAGNPLSARGASSIVGAVRAAYTLTRPSEDEVTAAGAIGGALVKMSAAKANYSPRDTAGTFFRIRGIRLGNGDPAGCNPWGDDVGVAERFTMPTIDVANAAAARAEAAERDALLRTIAEAMLANECALSFMVPKVMEARRVKRAKATELIDEALPLGNSVPIDIAGVRWLIEMRKTGTGLRAPKLITRRLAEAPEGE